MTESGDGPDTSSIKPISSLRSRFENLGKDQDAAPPSPIAGFRKSSLPSSTPTLGARPRTSAGEKSLTALDTPAANITSANAVPVIPTPRRRRPDPPPPRPTSMVSMRSQPSPPLVTIDSPRSPQKTFSLDLRTSAQNSTLPASTPNQMSESPSRAHSRNINRTATPALEARAAAFLQSAESQHLPPVKSVPDPVASEVKAKTDPFNGRPVVNRAAKPKVPLKPPVLAKKPSSLAAPELNAELTDQSISPFSTPPSSGQSSPDIRKEDAQALLPVRNPDITATGRPRVESDASWVQRIRGDSDASIAARARAGSNASFVESSSLPDSWLPPPTHHAVAAMKEPHLSSLHRAPTMPARYRPMTAQNTQTTDDLPEDRPRLPARPELQMRPGRTSPQKTRSGRTSPLKHHVLPPRRSVDVLRRSATTADPETHSRIPAVKPNQKSALALGFDRSVSPVAPAAPTPRRSTDRRREMPPPPPPPVANVASAGHSRDDQEDVAPLDLDSNQGAGLTEYPDATRANRRPPKFKQRPFHIPTDYDTKLLAVCGDYVCTTGYITKAWNLQTGEQLMHMEHRENTKVTSIVFKPSPNIEDEGKRIWVGTNAGEIHEIDIFSQSVVKTKTNAHSRREVIRMFRYASELWTMDDGGELYVWKPDHKGMPSLDSQYNNWRIPKGHSFSIATGKQLWYATGKDIRIFMPGALSDSEFQVLRSPLTQPGTGDVTSGATINSKPDTIYFGHSDGKVSIYNRRDFSCQGVVNVSVYRISSLAGVGEYLWAGYSTGMAYVYDASTTPWTVKKDWKAHEKQICSIIADPSAMWKMGRLNVVTLGLDNMLRIWDGMLADDWIEARMQARDSEFCSFREMTAAVLTWNAGATKPSYLQQSIDDSNFFQEYMTTGPPPELFVFGFQELVDLEDKKVTAKSFFKSKKKAPDEPEHMSHQYRAWRDHLTKCLHDYMPQDEPYTLLHTASMVGLFTCIYVKSSLRNRIRHVHKSEVKRGMGGMHGNKGALIVRMVLDDSSICFFNCHLAAGQTQTMHRNNDIAEILEANSLPTYPLHEQQDAAAAAHHSDVFAAGGDGSMILDHEICILNGDLNYRIDTMSRDAVVKLVQQNNLPRLLARDQLLLSRKKNPGFRLRAFQESPITFAPTYKYNVRTDEYDTSEKRRAPAWCDRILYRGLGKVKMEEYRRWDGIRVSDHRPVSGRLRLRVKTVDPRRREHVFDACESEYESVRRRVARAAQLDYLSNVLGMALKDAVTALDG